MLARTPSRWMLMCVLGLATGACGSDPRKMRFTSETGESTLAQLQTRKGLSVEETRMLYEYVSRTRLDVIEGTTPSLVGRTVGEAIAAERAWEQGHTDLIAQRQQAAASWKGRVEHARNEMNDALMVRVWEAREVESPPDSSVRVRRLTLRLGLSNGKSRTITAFEGAVTFSDMYGREQFECPIRMSEPLPGGEDAERLVMVECVPSPGRENRIRHVRLADTKMVWNPYLIRFDDGTVLSQPDE